MQKVDGVADGFTGSGQQTGTSVEQTVIAQSQHHQQFLGIKTCLFYSTIKIDKMNSAANIKLHKYKNCF